MAGQPVARRYAKAMLDIGTEQGSAEELREQLDAMAKLYRDSRPFRNALLNPSVKLEERRRVIKAIGQKLGLNEMLVNFVQLLLDNDRFRVLPDIAEQYSAMVDARSGRVRAQVTSAEPLDPAQQARLKAALGKLTGKDVLLQTEVDQDILGGVVTRIGTTIYDGSLRTQLETLRTSILEEV